MPFGWVDSIRPFISRRVAALIGATSSVGNLATAHAVARRSGALLAAFFPTLGLTYLKSIQLLKLERGPAYEAGSREFESLAKDTGDAGRKPHLCDPVRVVRPLR
jgi:hypothetical protein